MIDPDLLTPPGGSERWDLLVVGGGTAGLVGAQTAAGLGASVLLVERDRTGGDCLWTGCVPSKAFLAAAHAAADARAAQAVGIDTGPVRVDFPAVMAHVQRAIRTIEPVDSPEALRRAGVRVALGNLTLTGPQSAVLDGAPVRFRQALLATGSTAALPDVDGLADADPLTSDSVWSVTEQPGRLLVLGGGSIGVELGQGFARLGSTVTLVETAARLLPAEDADAAALLHGQLSTDGVDVRVGVGVRRIRRDAAGWSAELTDGSEVPFDRVLVATGRRPRTAGLGAEAAGVELDDVGHLRVDRHLRTANPRIWAAGDVTGHPQFTHVAGVHGSTAAINAVLGLRRTAAVDAVPRVTYTQPEIASVGIGADAAGAETVRTVRHTAIDRPITEARTDGFSRLVLDRKGRLVGATIVGPRAGESLAEAVLAVGRGLRAKDVVASMHAYPTYSDGLWNGAIEHVRASLGAPATRRAVGVLVRLRRRRMDRQAE